MSMPVLVIRTVRQVRVIPKPSLYPPARVRAVRELIDQGNGVRRGGARRVVRRGCRPDPDAHHAARGEAQASACGRVLLRTGGNRESGQGGGWALGGPPADAVVRGRQDRVGLVPQSM